MAKRKQVFQFKRQTTMRGVAREVLRYFEDPSRWWRGTFVAPTGQARCVLGAASEACSTTWNCHALYMAFRNKFADLVGGYPGNFNDDHGLEAVREVLRAIRDGREAAYKARRQR